MSCKWFRGRVYFLVVMNIFRTLSEDKRMLFNVTYKDGNYKLVDMTRLYQCADAYVAPYLSEAFCSPVLEAAACGLPIICTQGGPTEEFTSDEYALRIEAGWDSTTRTLAPDVTHLAQNMAFLLTNAGWRERARAVSADVTSRRYSWDTATTQLLQAIGL